MQQFCLIALYNFNRILINTIHFCFNIICYYLSLLTSCTVTLCLSLRTDTLWRWPWTVAKTSRCASYFKTTAIVCDELVYLHQSVSKRLYFVCVTFSPTVPPSAARISHGRGGTWWRKWERLKKKREKEMATYT